MLTSKRLILAHFWLAFSLFGLALLLGAWQMFVRSPLSAWVSNPEWYYRSLTAHGTVMGYVFPTLIAMGFGYAISEASLNQPIIGRRWAWLGFGLILVGAVMAMVPVALGLASVLYTFYPPDDRQPLLLFGCRSRRRRLLGLGCADGGQSRHLEAPQSRHARSARDVRERRRVPAVGLDRRRRSSRAAPPNHSRRNRLRSTIDAGLARVFFSWTLHAIVYFWLFPAYIAYYTIVPRAIGGKIYSDTMARISFILFLVVGMPIGLHHTFADPQVGAGFKFVQSVFTALVALPTFLTIFTICASLEIAAKLRGGKGALGWLSALPWNNPIMLAVAFSFIMLGFGGAGGLINMTYQLDATIHNTQWITGHFHLIFGGAIVIMYFAIAYDLWPHLTGRPLQSLGLMRAQLWLWFVGMIVTTFPWHWVGILGMPRRMAYFDYSNAALAPDAFPVMLSVVGAVILLISGILFFCGAVARSVWQGFVG